MLLSSALPLDTHTTRLSVFERIGQLSEVRDRKVRHQSGRWYGGLRLVRVQASDVRVAQRCSRFGAAKVGESDA